MFIRVLGAAAGGGYPQWNCNHPNSRLARLKKENAISQAEESRITGNLEKATKEYNLKIDLLSEKKQNELLEI